MTLSKIQFKSDVLPHVIAIIIFFIVTLIFFKPFFFDNKSLNQHDILQWEGSAKELLDYREANGEEGLWTNAMFGGMPGYLINTRFSGNLLIHVEKIYTLFLASPAKIIFASFLSFYILLLSFKVRPALAIAGALLFGLNSYNIIGFVAGHNARIAAVSYMPLVLAGIHLTFNKRWLWGCTLVMLGLGFNLRVNHYQITYYLLLMVAIYGLIQLFYAIKEKELKTFSKNVALLVIAVIIAVGSNIGRMWTIIEYSKYSVRGKSELTRNANEGKSDGLDKDYAFEFSNDILEPLVVFIPNFMGGASAQELESDSNLAAALKANGATPGQIGQQIKSVPTYFGNQRLSAPYYAGAIAVFLFILALFFANRKIKIWLTICTALGIMLSWGDNFMVFNEFLFDYLPGYNKFRSLTFTIIIAIISINLLGFIGLEQLLQTKWNKDVQKKLGWGVLISSGICILVIFYSWMGDFSGAIDERLGNLPEWFIQALHDDRSGLVRSDALRSLFYVVATAALIYFYAIKKLGDTAFSALIVVLALADGGLVAHRYLNNDKFERNPSRTFFSPTEANNLIKKDTSLGYRVYDLQGSFNDARASYHHQSIGGYHGAKLRRFQDLVEYHISPETNALISDIQSTGGTDMEKYGVLNMLNVKYLIAGNTANAVIQNPDHNGNAWIVDDVVVVNSADEEIERLGNINTKHIAVVDGSQNNIDVSGLNGQGDIQLTSYAPNKLTYSANVNGDVLAVFSEIYYPKGWMATIDGEPAEIYRADYALRALKLSAGSHEIEFVFAPKSYYTGNKIMLVFSVIFILILLTAIGYPIYNAMKYETDPEEEKTTEN